jgi:two-component system CheB/CheR fusion protein
LETALAEYLVHAPVFIRDLSGEIIYWTLGACELFGYSSDEAVGQNSHDLLKTDFPLPLEEINSILLESGRWEGILRHRRRDGALLWTESRWRLRDGGRGHKVVEASTDVTQREMLARELTHRTKNLMATVQGLARFSLAGDAERGLPVFEERLKALSDANDLLVRHSWSSAMLEEVVAATAARFAVEDRVRRSGPEITLQPGSVIAYGLALHELATNAIKYGALSVPDGRVDVTWSIEPENAHIHLFWRESGGPPVVAPERPGFGSRLIEQVLANELGTAAQLRFEPAGVVCEFDGPIQKEPAFEEEP